MPVSSVQSFIVIFLKNDRNQGGGVKGHGVGGDERDWGFLRLFILFFTVFSPCSF